MKKPVLLLSALLMAFGTAALSGCGGDGKIHVKFWHTMGHENQKLLNAMIAEFNKIYPDVKIDHTSGGDYTALSEKLESAIPAGKAPTMAFCYPDNVADYLSSNVVVDLSSYLEDENLKYTEEDGLVSDYQESYWKEGSDYQKPGLFSVPFAKSTEVLFYNKTIFDKYNLEVPTTWDEMWTLCRKVKEEVMPKESSIEFPLGYDSDANLFITLCEQEGIPYTTNENCTKAEDHILFNNDKAKAMATRIVGYMDEGLFYTKGCLPNNAYTSTYFTEGKIIMSIGSTGGTSYQVSENFTVAVAPAPATVAGESRYVSQGPSICFFKGYSQAQSEAAWNFYKFITRANNTAAYSKATGYEPVRLSSYDIPAYQEYLQGGTLQAATSKATALVKGRFFTSAVYQGSAAARDAVETIFANMYIADRRLDVNTAFANAYKQAKDSTKL